MSDVHTYLRTKNHSFVTLYANAARAAVSAHEEDRPFGAARRSRRAACSSTGHFCTEGGFKMRIGRNI